MIYTSPMEDDTSTAAGTSEDLEKLTKRTQPSDQVRYQMAILSLPYDKEWQMEDLDGPKVFMIALRLVYNRIRGVKVLHLGRAFT
ncbi:hypothetical protein ACN38_g12997 [Penicillium nordicum]|uniref:Uncharacterized protein n=1 Tax=Penicillium nordicum TaxID=229535 RepID=A0A0M8NWC4_9EURO|nr:hypothetical protein ACN38_g12997 [Penicillium nordicum]